MIGRFVGVEYARSKVEKEKKIARRLYYFVLDVMNELFQVAIIRVVAQRQELTL